MDRQERRNKIRESGSYHSTVIDIDKTLALYGYVAIKKDELPKWISVNDGLPKDGETVLIVAYGKYTIGDWHEDRQEFDATCMDIELSEVSHWMPLPSLPE